MYQKIFQLKVEGVSEVCILLYVTMAFNLTIFGGS
jgi:hypothetical protein